MELRTKVKEGYFQTNVYEEPYKGFLKKLGFNSNPYLIWNDMSYRDTAFGLGNLNLGSIGLNRMLYLGNVAIKYKNGSAIYKDGELEPHINAVSLEEIESKEKKGKKTDDIIPSMIASTKQLGGFVWYGYCIDVQTTGSDQRISIEEDFKNSRQVAIDLVSFSLRRVEDLYSKIDETKFINFAKEFEHLIGALHQELRKAETTGEINEGLIDEFLSNHEKLNEDVGIASAEKEFYEGVNNYCSERTIDIHSEMGHDFRRKGLINVFEKALD